jgi:hypothetical protein
MNRLKVWLYAFLVAAISVGALLEHSIQLRKVAIAGVDVRLAAGAAHVEASARALAREASAAAAFTVRDEKLVAYLHAKEFAARRGRGQADADTDAEEAALSEAARAALTGAEKTFGFELPGTTVVTAGNREWLARKGPPSVAEGEAMAFLRAAIDGLTRRGYVRLSGKVFYGAASPAGTGAGLVVLVPLDDAWARETSAATGVDVTVAVPEAKPVSTARAQEAEAIGAWTRGAGVAVDLGRFDRADIALGPLKLPRMPLLFGGAPAARARAVALEGVKNGYAVVSAPTGAVLGPVAQAQWRAVAVLAVLVLVGFVLGFLVRSTGPAAPLPEALVAAAGRIDRGDFGARSPAFAGKLGTIASALNKAAELAGSTSPRAANDHAPAAGASAGAGGDALRVAAAELLQAAAQTAAPAAAADEETYWQEVYQDFLRTRASCGESAEGLTYDKFKVKLEGNKAQLVSKYGCKSVRFQVYVKDGKAALKATPVR